MTKPILKPHHLPQIERLDEKATNAADHVKLMKIAQLVAKRSACTRAKVGALILFTTGEMFVGWNKNPTGQPCECEKGKTVSDVIHAEIDAINHAYTAGFETNGATLYVTRQPCINCARAIVEAGITHVYYRDSDDKSDGLELLAAHGVKVDSGWLAGQRDPLIEPTLMQKIQASWLARWSV